MAYKIIDSDEKDNILIKELTDELLAVVISFLETNEKRILNISDKKEDIYGNQKTISIINTVFAVLNRSVLGVYEPEMHDTIIKDIISSLENVLREYSKDLKENE